MQVNLNKGLCVWGGHSCPPNAGGESRVLSNSTDAGCVSGPRARGHTTKQAGSFGTFRATSIACDM
jgi:hypothetical protein